MSGADRALLDELLRAERLALLEQLEVLDEAAWAVPSLCAGWTVQHVAAHLAWAPVLRPGAALRGLAGAGFDPNRFNRRTATAWTARGRAAVLAQLRENAVTLAAPPGVPRAAAVLEAVLHGLDVRRPLGLGHRTDLRAVRTAADVLVRTRWPLNVTVGGSAGARVRGRRLVAEDVGWQHGQGPEVRGSGEALLLLLSGRPVGPDELSGPGAADVRRGPRR
ncbi:maleylpyruvate isomerase family mycothiol-dependent enzyme [Kineococcus sp. SYSU DK004]|uniref:maleylpyruvate isomerase family mycothiol-dependent enzyme n=1 Tax=Kineococcus sp. SYSU DK004 TaxID=3383125 RepID=UPI003D7EF59E